MQSELLPAAQGQYGMLITSIEKQSWKLEGQRAGGAETLE